MRHEYDDEQINDASRTAANYGSCGELHSNYLRRFLDALTEPQDDWQKCGFNDFHPTDKRVKAAFIGGSIIEGTPDRRNSEHVFLVDGPVIHSYDDATFYRIPAPVQHPHPLDHPVIIVQNANNICWMARPAYWDSGQQAYAFLDATCTSFAPSEITEWEPADIVPKEVADGDR